MSNYNIKQLKEKIAPRDQKTIRKEYASRFDHTKVVRKTFCFPEEEVEQIKTIKNVALGEKVVLSDSEIIRLGLLSLTEFSKENLVKLTCQLKKIPVGRPPRK